MMSKKKRPEFESSKETLEKLEEVVIGASFNAYEKHQALGESGKEITRDSRGAK